MRIIQPCGPSHRDDGAPLYIQRWLNRFPGVTCDRFPVTVPADQWGDYDAVVYVDWAQDAFNGLPPFVPDPAKRSVCWQSDTHWKPEGWSYRMEQAVHYGTAAFAQRNAADVLAKGPPPFRVEWMPHAADHYVYYPAMRAKIEPPPKWEPDFGIFEEFMCEVIPRWDLCFVGYMQDPSRQERVERMFQAIPNFCFRPGVFFEEASKVYHFSRVVFNPSARGDLNMRTFEALAARSFMLADRQQGMDTLGLKNGEHCLIYDTMEEAIELAKEWSDPSKDRKRIEIADAGWRWCLANHTYWHRAKTILGWLGITT